MNFGLDPGTDLAGDFCASRIETEDRKKPRKMPTFKGDASMTTYSQINEKVRRSIRRSGIPPISRHRDWNPNRSAPNRNQAPWALMGIDLPEADFRPVSPESELRTRWKLCVNREDRRHCRLGLLLQRSQHFGLVL